MFFIIGLKQDGRRVLCDGMEKEPNGRELTGVAEACNYQQLLVITSDNTQIARYEFDPEPKVKEVPLVWAGE